MLLIVVLDNNIEDIRPEFNRTTESEAITISDKIREHLLILTLA